MQVTRQDMMLDDHDHRRFLRYLGQFCGISKIVHDIPEFREMPSANSSMEQKILPWSMSLPTHLQGLLLIAKSH